MPSPTQGGEAFFHLVVLDEKTKKPFVPDLDVSVAGLTVRETEVVLVNLPGVGMLAVGRPVFSTHSLSVSDAEFCLVCCPVQSMTGERARALARRCWSPPAG